MESLFADRSGGDPARPAEEPPGPGRPLTPDDSADCCPARPVVTVIMPPASGRPLAADLRLCGHHYRVSSTTLRASGATMYDASGAVIARDDDGRLAARRPSAPASAPVPSRGRRGWIWR